MTNRVVKNLPYFAPMVDPKTSMITQAWQNAFAQDLIPAINASGSGSGGTSDGSAEWGKITGTLNNQIDLFGALTGKQDKLGFTPINKAGDSGIGELSVSSLKVAGGLSTQFLKGDGSLDAGNYLSSIAVTSPLQGTGTAVDPINLSFTPINKAGDTGIGSLSMGALTATTGIFSDNVTIAKPDARLYVRGGGATSGFLIEQDATKAVYLWNYENTALNFATNNQTRLQISANGIASFQGNAVTMGALTASTGTFSGAVFTTNAVSNAAAGVAKGVYLRSGNVSRWYINSSSSAESGSDAGSPLLITAYNDAGVGIDVPISITRASGGAITLSRPIAMPKTTKISNNGNGAQLLEGLYSGIGEAYSSCALVMGTNIKIDPTDTVNTQVRIKETHASLGYGFWKVAGNTTNFYGATGSVVAGDIITPTEIFRAGTAGVISYVPLTVNAAMSATIGSFSGGYVSVNSAASTPYYELKNAGVRRFLLYNNSTGSQTQFVMYDGTGTLVDSAMVIQNAAGGLITLSRPTSITDTTASTGYNTGSLKVAGGLGVAGRIYAGDLISTASSIYSPRLNLSKVANPTIAITEAGFLRNYIWLSSGNFYITSFDSSGAYIDDALSITNTTGGLITSRRPVSIASTTDATSTTTGSLKLAGGLGIVKKLYAGDSVILTNTTDSILGTAASGVLQVAGGATIQRSLQVGGNVLSVGTLSAASGMGGNLQFRDDTATSRYLVGILGSAAATSFVIYDVPAGASRFTMNTTGDISLTGILSVPSLLLNSVNQGIDRNNNDLRWRYDGTNYGIVYHSGNIDTSVAAIQALKALVNAPTVGTWANYASLPALPDATNYPVGSYAFSTVIVDTAGDNTAGTLYQNQANVWVRVGSGTMIAGKIVAGNISAGSIGTAALAAGSVTAAKILASTITANEIASATITGDRLVAGTITATQIAADTITSANIAANTITGGDIAATTITAANIAATTITAANIAAGTLTATQIQAGSITGDRLTASTITATQIASQTITASQIATGTLTATQMTAGTITAASGILADAVITTAKIADLNVTTGKIALLAVDTAQIKDAAITTAKITDANITTAKIADLNVTTAKIALLAVDTAQIKDAAITNAKITNLDAAKITTGILGADRIGANSITASKLESILVVSNQIKSSDYTQDGTGKPTAGFKLDSAETTYKFKVGSGWFGTGVKIGSSTYTLGDTAGRALTGIAASGTSATDVIWWRGNSDPSVNSGAPVIIDPLWAKDTTYALGDRRIAGTYASTLSYANGRHVYECTTAGAGLTTAQTSSAAYSAATTYAAGNTVTYLSNVYSSKAAGNLNHTPTVGGDAYWNYLGCVNGPYGTIRTTDSYNDGAAKWKCVGWMYTSTTATAGCKPWARSTAYAVGDLMASDVGATLPGYVATAEKFYGQPTGAIYNPSSAFTNCGATRIYRCVTAGTSSASGNGPTGATTGITDGTCVWDYWSENTGPEDRVQIWGVNSHGETNGGELMYEVRIQPKTNKDNLDALTHLEVEPLDYANAWLYRGTLHNQLSFPIPSRKYYSPSTPNHIGNMVRINITLSNATSNSNSYINASPYANQQKFQICLHNVHGNSVRIPYINWANQNIVPTPYAFSLPSAPTGSGGSGGGGTSCPEPWVLVLTERGEIPAGEVVEGDVVITKHETTAEEGRFTVTHASIEENETAMLTVLKTDAEGNKAEKSLAFALNHRFVRKGEWTQLRDILPGSTLESTDGSTITVVSVEPRGINPVVKITVEEAHTYSTEGVLSHNIKILD